MTRGTKLPYLFHCVDEADEGVDVVLKFGFELYRREFSLVAEAVAAQLAPDLGLAAAEGFIVDLPDAVAALVDPVRYPNHARAARASVGWNFGSRFAGPGGDAIPPPLEELQLLREPMTDVLAFDFLIQNLDRRENNPNHLRYGDRIVLIDHEDAFGQIAGADEPVLGPDLFLTAPFHQHVFYRALNLTSDFDRLFDRFGALDINRLRDYRENLPNEWLDTRSERIFSYLAWAHAHPDEIKEVLSYILP